MSDKQFQDRYNKIFQEMKEEKMNWEFDDFLKQVEKPSENEKKIIPISPKAKPIFSKIFWLAASLVLVAGLFFLIKKINEPSLQQQDEMVKNEILKQKQQNEFFVSNETEADSQQNKEKDSLVGSAKPDAEAEQMMNKILPKRGRIKKQTRERYTQNETKKIEQETKKTSEYQEGFVIINGQKIENEKEAIDVTRYSLQLLSEKVTQTVAKTEPITDFVEF